MATVNLERWARAAGVVFVVLFVVAFLVAGEAPAVSAPAEEVVSYFDDDRGMILTGAVIWATAWIALLWFGAAIANILREAGEGRSAALTLAAVTGFVGLQLGVLGVSAALAHSVAGAGEPAVVKSAYVIGWAIDVIAALPLAVFVVAASLGLARVGALPAWVAPAGLVAGAVTVLRATNWASDGFWSPSGGYIFVVTIAVFLWILATSAALFRSAAHAGATERTAPTLT